MQFFTCFQFEYLELWTLKSIIMHIKKTIKGNERHKHSKKWMHFEMFQ